MGMGEKTPKYTKNEYENQGKIPRLDAPHPTVYEMENDCFPELP